MRGRGGKDKMGRGEAKAWVGKGVQIMAVFHGVSRAPVSYR
jgi:hypothetical protein